MKRKDTIIIKGSKLTFDQVDNPALDRIRQEYSEEEIGGMDLQGFLIAFNKAEKEEALNKYGQHRSDNDLPVPNT